MSVTGVSASDAWAAFFTPGLGAVPDQIGLVSEDVLAVHAEDVAEVLVVRADLEHLEDVGVVAV